MDERHSKFMEKRKMTLKKHTRKVYQDQTGEIRNQTHFEGFWEDFKNMGMEARSIRAGYVKFKRRYGR